MAKIKRKPDRAAGEAELRRHRARILFTLLGICRNFERLQMTPVARRACRGVTRLIDDALNREIMARPGSRRSLGSR
jgi:hypothetical protein